MGGERLGANFGRITVCFDCGARIFSIVIVRPHLGQTVPSASKAFRSSRDCPHSQESSGLLKEGGGGVGFRPPGGKAAGGAYRGIDPGDAGFFNSTLIFRSQDGH